MDGRRSSMKHKAVIVLAHLLKGGRSFQVTFSGENSPRTLVLDENYELCELRRVDDDQEVLLKVFGIDMGPFVKLCEKISTDDAFAIGAATAMIEMANERPPRVTTGGDPAHGD